MRINERERERQREQLKYVRELSCQRLFAFRYLHERMSENENPFAYNGICEFIYIKRAYVSCIFVEIYSCYAKSVYSIISGVIVSNEV